MTRVYCLLVGAQNTVEYTYMEEQFQQRQHFSTDRLLFTQYKKSNFKTITVVLNCEQFKLIKNK